MKIEIIDDPTSEDIAVLYDALTEFNEPYFPNLDIKSIGCFIRNDAGKIIGGLTAKVLFSSLHINLLWLAGSIRNSGIGSELIAIIENDAISKGAQRVYVDTYTFQGIGFYEKLGFKEVGRYVDYPKEGVDKVFYMKNLL